PDKWESAVVSESRSHPPFLRAPHRSSTVLSTGRIWRSSCHALEQHCNFVGVNGMPGGRVVTDQQRQEFETLVDDTVRRIESGLFLPHSGIRFPQNPCTTCPFLGLCLDQRDLVESGL